MIAHYSLSHGPAIRRATRAAVRHGAAAVGSRVDGYLPRFRSFLTRGLTVFVFHEVTDTPSEFQRRTHGYVTNEVFRNEMAWIGERFEFISPTALMQLGGSGDLPAQAGLVSFDDAWAGVFRVGLPILASLGVPALCFLNMATVDGTPDLSAVRLYERLRPPEGGPRLDRPIHADEADGILAAISKAYKHDQEYSSFQGATATHDDLIAAVTESRNVWFGSHLFHHWDLHRISHGLFIRSVQDNAEALAAYSNSVPALATPYGHELNGLSELKEDLGVALVFVATGGQNRDPSAPVLDRLALQPEPSGPHDWWYSAHRRRLFGSLPS
jgi:peptidoglycan/xylan/chitin deacetylase (PgdA/CDA1 family)